MARRRRRLASGMLAMATACAVGAACGGFSSEDPPSAASEGGAGAETSSPPDGPVGPDAADGGSDARACPTVLDEPFDATTFSGNGWGLDVTDGGTVTHDPNVFGVSAPSMHATVAVSAGAPAYAELNRDYHITSSGVGTVTASFSMFVQAPVGASTYSELGCGLFFQRGSTETIVSLALLDNQDLVTVLNNPDGGVAPDEAFLFEPALQGWYDVTITVASVSTAATVDFAVTNDAGMTKTASFQAGLPANLDTMRVGCGIHYARLLSDAGTSTTSVRVDDVHVTRCPP